MTLQSNRIEAPLWHRSDRWPHVFNLNQQHPLPPTLGVLNAEFVTGQKNHHMELGLVDGRRVRIDFDPKVKGPQRIRISPDHAPLVQLTLVTRDTEITPSEEREVLLKAVELFDDVKKRFKLNNHARALAHAAESLKKSE